MLYKIKKHYKQGTLITAVFNKISKMGPMYYLYRDIRNRIKSGKDAPVFAERIWINPLDCRKALAGKYILSGLHSRKGSGLVV